MTDGLQSKGESPTNIGGSGKHPLKGQTPFTGGEGITAQAGVTGGAASTAAALSGNATSFSPGQVVANRFKILRTIGCGGMAVVYEAEDFLTHERVALKAILPAMLQEPGARRRFSREVNTGRRLRHKGLVKVFDLMMSDDTLFFTMECLRGETLRDYLNLRERIDFPFAFHVIDSVAEALEHCHKIAVHRDISPENIMILPDESVKLLDFGIAKPIEAHQTAQTTQTTQTRGKAYYAAPEQRKPGTQPDVKMDIWSLGVCLFEMLTGELPMGFQRVTRCRPNLPPELDDLIARSVCAHEQRYASMTEFRQALQQCMAAYDNAISARVSPPQVNAASRNFGWFLGHRGLTVGIGAVFALALLVPVWSLIMANRPEAPQTQAASAPGSTKAAPVVLQDPWDFSGYWSGGVITGMRLEKEERGVSGWYMSNDDKNRCQKIKGGRVDVLPDGKTEAVLLANDLEMTATFDESNRTCDLRVKGMTNILHFGWPLGRETVIEAEQLPFAPVLRSTVAYVASFGPWEKERLGVEVVSLQPGGGVAFSLDISKRGTYVVGVVFGLGHRRAAFQGYFDGEALGAPISTECNGDEFSGTYWLGERMLSSGTHTLTLAIADPASAFRKEVGSKTGEKNFFIDSVVLMEPGSVSGS